MLQIRSTLRSAVIVGGLCVSIFGQSPDQSAPAAAPPPNAEPSGRNWTFGGVQVSGMLDGYYVFNNNHPSTGKNQVRAFDVYSNQPDLSFAKTAIEYSPGPIGFRVDFGFGEGFNAFHWFDPNNDLKPFHHFQQAYVSFKPKSWHGIEIDGGKFFTSAGAELTDTQSNWNYSRSLLFALGPYYHVGIRTSFPVGKRFTGGVQFVNGWNDLVDNNTGKTLGFTGTYSAGNVSWANTYYTGPEHTDTNRGWRHFYDSVLTVVAGKKTAMYVNFDYGIDRNVGTGASKFYGIAYAVHYAATSRISFTPRVEWYNDRDGWATGTPQKLKEYTLTAEYKMFEGFLGRLEWRQDFSDQPFFHRGNDQLVKSQPTLILGFVAFFGPKH
jgi:hypothetical protein